MVANNIKCPKCGGENCFVNEDEKVVDVHCTDCGYHEQTAKESTEEQNEKKEKIEADIERLEEIMEEINSLADEALDICRDQDDAEEVN